MTLDKIIGIRAEDVIQSGFSVNINDENNTVTIDHVSGDDDLSIHLVGHYGEKFIADCKKQHKLLPNTCFGSVLLAKAQSYLNIDEMPICA